MSNSLRQKTISGLFWLGGARAVIQVMSWIITVVVARVLSPADYGLYGMALLYIGLVEFLNEMGLGRAIINKKDLSNEQLYSLFWFTNGVGLFFLGVTYLIAPLIAMFFNQPLLTHLLWFIGLIHVISSMQQIPWNLLTRDIDFKRRSISEATSNFLSGMLTIVLAFKGWGVWSLAWGFLTRNVLTMIMVFFQTGWRPKCVFDWGAVKPLLGFSVNVMGGQLLWYANGHSPLLVIGKILGDHALGYYTLAVRLTTDLSDRVMAVVNQVSFPVYSKMQDQGDRLKLSLLASLELVCACIFPFLGGLILVADDIIPLLLGPNWVPMIVPFKILAASGLFSTLDSLLGPPVLAKGGPLPFMHMSVLYLAVLPACYVVGAQFGLERVCLVSVSIYPVLVLVWLLRARDIIDFKWSELWRAVSPAVLGVCIMLPVIAVIKIELLSDWPPVLRLIVTVLLGFLVYGSIFMMTLSRPIGDLIRSIRPHKDTSPNC